MNNIRIKTPFEPIFETGSCTAIELRTSKGTAVKLEDNKPWFGAFDNVRIDIIGGSDFSVFVTQAIIMINESTAIIQASDYYPGNRETYAKILAEAEPYSDDGVEQESNSDSEDQLRRLSNNYELYTARLASMFTMEDAAIHARINSYWKYLELFNDKLGEK